MHSNRKKIFYLIPLFLLIAACIMRSPARPLSDYAGYYFGGKELLKGRFMNAYDMQVLNFSITAQGQKGVFVSYAPFPPFTSLVFAPFTIFSVGVSKVLFNIFSCMLFVFTLFRTARFFSIPNYLLLLVPAIFFYPIVNNVFFGQSYLLLCCILLEGFMAYKQQKIVLSSFLWAFAILFKLFPIVIFLFLLLRKKNKNIGYLIAACCLLMLVSVFVNGVDAWKYYITVIVPKLNVGELNDPFTAAFQSAYMLCKRFFLYDELQNPHPIFQNPYLFVVIMGLFKAFIVSVCIVFTFRKKENDFISFGVWIMASMLVSPNGSSYSLILLIIPLLALADQRDNLTIEKPFVLPLAIAVLFVACIINVQLFSSFFVLGQFPRLYLLLLFFLLLVKQTNCFNIRLILGLSIVFIGMDIFKYIPKKDNSAYLLTKEKDIFIYDYTAKNDRLVYISWDGESRETITDQPIQSLSNQKVIIKNNQIFYTDKQITASPDEKRKAMVMNGNTIIYLSDKNRGVGFYTLRKLVLDTAR